MGNGIQMNYWKQTCHNNWELQNISYFFQKQFCSKVIESDTVYIKSNIYEYVVMKK